MSKQAPDSEESSDSENSEASELNWDIFDDRNESFKFIDAMDSCEVESNQNLGNNDTPTNGLHWAYNGTITSIPNNKMPDTSTTLKSGSNTLFSTPIKSMVTMFPLLFWEIIVAEINRYAEQKLCLKKNTSVPKKRNLINGYKWIPVTLNEVMCYFGILIYFMLYPQTRGHLRDAWDAPYHNAWLKFMSRGRFQQNSSVLHFNNNADEEGLKCDSSHKIRPLLNIIKKTLGVMQHLAVKHPMMRQQWPITQVMAGP